MENVGRRRFGDLKDTRFDFYQALPELTDDTLITRNHLLRIAVYYTKICFSLLEKELKFVDIPEVMKKLVLEPRVDVGISNSLQQLTIALDALFLEYELQVGESKLLKRKTRMEYKQMKAELYGPNYGDKTRSDCQRDLNRQFYRCGLYITHLEEKMSRMAKDPSEETKETAAEGSDKTEETTAKGSDKTEETAARGSDKTKEMSAEGSDKTEETAARGSDKTEGSAAEGSDESEGSAAEGSDASGETSSDGSEERNPIYSVLYTEEFRKVAAYFAKLKRRREAAISGSSCIEERTDGISAADEVWTETITEYSDRALPERLKFLKSLKVALLAAMNWASMALYHII